MANSNSNRTPYSYLKPVLRPILPKIIRASVVMSVSVVLLAVLPLVINELRTALSGESSSSTSVSSSNDTTVETVESTHEDVFTLTVSLFNQLLQDPLLPLRRLSFFIFNVLDEEDFNIAVAGLKLLSLLLSHSVISYFGHYLSDIAAISASNALRKKALQSILKLDWALRLSSSDMNPTTQASTWLESISAVHDIIANVITNVFPTIVNCAVTWIALFIQSKIIAVGLGSVLVSMAVFAQFRSARKKRKRLAQQKQQADSSSSKQEEVSESEKLSNAVTENFAQCQGFLATILDRFATIKVYHGQELVTNKLHTILNQLEQDSATFSHHVHWTCGNGSRKMTVVYVLAGVVVIILHRHGLIGFLTDLAVVGFYARHFISSCQSAYDMINKTEVSFSKALPLCRLYQLAEFDEEERKRKEIDDIDEADRNGNHNGSKKKQDLLVKVEGVAATYKSKKNSFSHLQQQQDSSEDNITTTGISANNDKKKPAPGITSCTLKPITSRSVVLLRGENGHGKSTLQKVVLGMMNPDKGQVIRQNANIAMLSQEPVLLGGCTIAENICMTPLPPKSSNRIKEEKEDHHDQDETRNKIISAAKRAICHDVIMKLKDGYDTVIDGTGSIGGSCLSGGQLQRICAARMLYSGANFLLLDEPTNNLDAQSAATILNVIVEEECRKRGCAAMIVTHDTKFFTAFNNKVGDDNNDCKNKIDVRVVTVHEGKCNEE